MSVRGKNVLITGASMGIGEKLAITLASAEANIILFSRTEIKLKNTVSAVKQSVSSASVSYHIVDIQKYDAVKEAVDKVVKEHGHIDVLINNAGLALGAPSRFDNLNIEDIVTMNQTNVNGTMFVTYAVLNASMAPRNSGTILNVSSVTGLEVPPFPGEAVYHANKAAMEGFSNALRNELVGTDIKVLVVRPGIVDTNFHEQRVGYDKELHDEFFEGFDALKAQDIADAALYMLSQPLNISIKALDVVATGQRSLTTIDREWNSKSRVEKRSE